MTPPDNITSLDALTVYFSPLCTRSMPVAVFPCRLTLVTSASVNTLRLGRPRFGLRYPVAE